MSEIDTYKHECIVMVRCPSSYLPPRSWGPDPKEMYIPLYMLHEDALDSDSFQAKKGDLLLGGGSGESSALWIAMPEAVLFFTREDWEDFIKLEDYSTIGQLHDSLYYAFWSM